MAQNKLIIHSNNLLWIDYNSRHTSPVTWRRRVLSRDCDKAQSLLRFSLALLHTFSLFLQHFFHQTLNGGHLNAHPRQHFRAVHILGGLCTRFTCQTVEDFPAGLCVHRASISPHAAVGRVQLGHGGVMVPVF